MSRFVSQFNSTLVFALTAAGLLAATGGALANAAILNVPGSFATIQAAVNAANSGDEVVISPGTYTGVGNRDVDLLGKTITIRSSNPTDPGIVAATVIDCQMAGRAFVMQSGETPSTVLDGLTITSGNASAGAAVYCINQSGATMRNSVIRDCTTTAGVVQITNNLPGSAGDLVIDGCDIGNNIGTGVQTRFISTLTVTDSVVHDNSDAGVDNLGYTTSSVTVLNSSISHNGGLGISRSTGGPFEVSNSVIADNQGTGLWLDQVESAEIVASSILRNGNDGSGGGVRIFGGGVMLVRNCLIAENTAASGGGVQYGPSFNLLIMTNCTVSGNTATVSGGGIGVAAADAVIQNCVTWGNTSPDGPQLSLSSGQNHPALVDVEYSLFEGGQSAVTVHSITGATSHLVWGPGNSANDPAFEQPAAGDYRLQAGSPAIDAGDNNAMLGGATTDLDGNPRFHDDLGTPDTGLPDGVNPPVDMGAYEFQGLSCPGDLDHDGEVGLSDLAQLLANYGTISGASYEDGDLTGDGDVDLADLAEMLSHYGASC